MRHDDDLLADPLRRKHQRVRRRFGMATVAACRDSVRARNDEARETTPRSLIATGHVNVM